MIGTGVRALFALGAGCVLSGCAQGVWVKDGADQYEFVQAQQACTQHSDVASPTIYNRRGHVNLGATLGASLGEAIMTGIADGLATRNCMQGLGWRLEQSPTVAVASAPPPVRLNVPTPAPVVALASAVLPVSAKQPSAA